MQLFLTFALSSLVSNPPDTVRSGHRADSTPAAAVAAEHPAPEGSAPPPHDSVHEEIPGASLEKTGKHGKADHRPVPTGPKPLPTRLCGPLPRDVLNWNPKNGALRLGGRLVVGAGQSLVLPQGALVVADPDTSCRDSSGSPSLPGILVAGGTLSIRGTWRNPVVLRPLREGTDLAWEGIQVSGAREGDVNLDWLEVRRARVGVNFSAGTGEVRHAVASDCGIGFAAVAGAAPRIRHSIVHRSRVADLVSERSAPLVQSCLFLDGLGDGLRFDGTGLARISTSLFWNHRGLDLVRGPAGVGGWKSDTAPDAYGNWRRDPVFRGSAKDVDSSAKLRKEIAAAPWWKHRRFPELPWGVGPWVPSPFSPLLGAGERRMGKRVDIGLWDQQP